MQTPDPTIWIILGALIVLWIALGIYQRRSTQQEGREINDEMQTRVNDGPELVDADPAEFHWLKLNFYDQTRDQLEALGFRVIGDFENLTETKVTPYFRRFSRIMVSRDGTIQANIVMIRALRRKMPLKFIWIPLRAKRLISLESETIDGVKLITANTEGILPELDLPGLVNQYLPPETYMPYLHKTHRKAMDIVLEGAPEMHFKTCRTRDDVIRLSLEEHEWMKSCNAYHAIVTTTANAQIQNTDNEDMQKVTGDILNAYLRERERRKTMLDQIKKN